jgi:hypothetical protein
MVVLLLLSTRNLRQARFPVPVSLPLPVNLSSNPPLLSPGDCGHTNGVRILQAVISHRFDVDVQPGDGIRYSYQQEETA